MTSRGLIVAWVAAGVIVLLLLGVGLIQWIALSAEATRAAGERRRLTDELRLRDEQLAATMRAHARDLSRMQWSAAGGDPAGFLTRLAELAGERRLKVVAVGPLERQSTAQWSKSWHAIQVVGPYREIRELAARVEAERGILQDVRIEPAPAPPSGRPDGPAASEEIQARFRMTALELSQQAKRVLERVLAAGPASGQPSASTAPALPPVAPGSAGPPLIRDPFAFGAGTPAASSRPPSPPVAEKPAVPLALTAIMGVPGGNVAVINNQIVKVGDVVSGHRVERITDQSVTLQEPGAPPRTIQLPELGAAPPRR